MIPLTLKDFLYFRFKQIEKNTVLLTNDIGDYLKIDSKDFNTLRSQPDQLKASVVSQLEQHRFIHTPQGVQDTIEGYRKKYWFLENGTSLHIMVVTLRCDHACSYCQVSRVNLDSPPKYDMDKRTAEKCVDFILQSAANEICIEFQGGEPLVNYEIIVHTIEYVKKINSSKKITFGLVTNCTYLNNERLEYLLTNNVSICVSLDGHEALHNVQRRSKNNSYQNTIEWLARIKEESQKRWETTSKYNKVNAIATITKDSLSLGKEIIDTYIQVGVSFIQLRPLQPYGFVKKTKSFANYSVDEFLEFYRKSLDYIVLLNRQGKTLYEKTAQVYLKKIIEKVDPNYLDLRSPGGFGIGSLAYNYDGQIFTCDEGRMLYEMGDSSFLLGNVEKNTYNEVIESEIVRTLAIASTLEGIPKCSECVYNPYCSVSPLYNYAMQDTLFGQMATNERHKIAEGILDYLFLTIEKNLDIYTKWTQEI